MRITIVRFSSGYRQQSGKNRSKGLRDTRFPMLFEPGEHVAECGFEANLAIDTVNRC